MFKKLIQQLVKLFWFVFNAHKVYDVERRNSKQYKKKKSIVVYLWIYSCTLICIIGIYAPPNLTQCVAIVGGLLTTFFSFVFLDETEDDQ